MVYAFLAVALGVAPVQLAQPELQGVNVARETLAFFGEHLADRLRHAGFNVMTQREIATLLGVERQRALLGCEEQATSCIAELASALGADGVVVGDIGHFNDIYQVHLKVLSGGSATVLSSFSERVGSERQVLDALERGAGQLSAQTHTQLRRPMPAALEVTHASARSLAWVPAVPGAALAVAGAVLLVLAGNDYALLTGPKDGTVIPSAAALVQQGELKRGFGVGALALGGAALAASVLMAVLGRGAPDVAVAPVVSHQGAGFVLTGAFP